MEDWLSWASILLVTFPSENYLREELFANRKAVWFQIFARLCPRGARVDGQIPVLRCHNKSISR